MAKIIGETIDKVAQGRERATEHVGRAPAVHHAVVPHKRNLERRKRVEPHFGFGLFEPALWPEQECTVQPSAATVSGAVNFHRGKRDCTIS